MDVQISEDPAGECAELLCEAASAGQHIVITGGSTPGAAYERAASMGADWSDARIWFSDDRCVPPDDELSNYRLVKETLLDRLDAPPAEVNRIRGELGPHPGADHYETQLAEVDRLDLVL